MTFQLLGGGWMPRINRFMMTDIGKFDKQNMTYMRAKPKLKERITSMEKKLNRYQFDKISSTMAKEYGKIKSGEEDLYSMILISMEGNLLKLHRADEKRDGRSAGEAIHICLLRIEEYLTDWEYDLTAFLTPENESLARGLMMSFDPFTNDEVRAVVEQYYDLGAVEELKSYYQVPIRCLLRIEKSIELWTKNCGSNGYFNFLESNIGTLVERDQKMNFSVQMP